MVILPTPTIVRQTVRPMMLVRQVLIPQVQLQAHVLMMQKVLVPVTAMKLMLSQTVLTNNLVYQN